LSMRALASHNGFKIQMGPDLDVVEAVLELR
jgi:hypothetical protein